MAEKKKISNKSEKATTEKKASAKKKVIDWDSIPIILNGKEIKCGKPSAKILVEAGKAKLK